MEDFQLSFNWADRDFGAIITGIVIGILIFIISSVTSPVLASRKYAMTNTNNIHAKVTRALAANELRIEPNLPRTGCKVSNT